MHGAKKRKGAGGKWLPLVMALLMGLCVLVCTLPASAAGGTNVRAGRTTGRKSAATATGKKAAGQKSTAAGKNQEETAPESGEAASSKGTAKGSRERETSGDTARAGKDQTDTGKAAQQSSGEAGQTKTPDGQTAGGQEDSIPEDDGDIYDIILFFGQSNMVGESLKTNLLYDTDAASLAEVSSRTGIALDLLEHTRDCELTYIPLEEDSAYQYSLIDDAFYPLKPGEPTGNFGRAPRAVAWDPNNRQWVEVFWNQNIPVALGYSDMINMVPEFCRAYYEKTGHKVIAVSCALGGVPIQAYLPMEDAHYRQPPAYAENRYAYMYKGVVDSFTGAVQKAEQNGWTIGGKYFVSFQGEADLYNDSYNDYYMQVIRQWQQLGITDGALVETSYTIGDAAGAGGVRDLHESQEQIIRDNPNIVLGSSFDYDHYVPDPGSYDSYWKKKWNQLPYDEAYEAARYLTDSEESNRVHLNSATLSQIGRETAVNLANHVLP